MIERTTVPLGDPPCEPPPARAEEDFRAAVFPHLRPMLSAARAILASEDLAWDAVQETLLRVWFHGELPPEPRGVLVSLARRSSLHILRCRRRRDRAPAQYS